MEVLSLSDADDQMGGTGGDTGPKPGAGKAQEGGQEEDDAVTEESKESFPASDPPANY